MTHRILAARFLMITLCVAVPTSLRADSSPTSKKAKALQRIAACMRRNEVSSRQCRHLNQDVTTLVDVYRQGDKSVLPTLLKFTYLTDFYGETLINDPQGFLTAVSRLHDSDRRAVATGLAGGIAGVSRSRFEGIRATLMGVSTSSQNYQLARMFLGTLETENASFLVTYFPPLTFTGRARDLLVHWYSREFYRLGEKPIWQEALGNKRIYRVTVLPAFGPPESVSLTVTADGTGQIEFRRVVSPTGSLVSASTLSLSPNQFSDFTAALIRSQFWQLSTEPPRSSVVVMDGADWILEGLDNGKYYIVTRTCPGNSPFGEAARKLFDLSGHKSKGEC